MYDQHCAGQKHARKLEQTKGSRPTPALPLLKAEPTENKTTTEELESKNVTPAVTTSKTANSSQNIPTFDCGICKITGMFKMAYDQHLIGQKHRKTLLTLGMPVPDSEPSSAAINNAPASVTNIDLFSALFVKQSTGSFTCELCECSAPSSSQFQVHVNGKKHLKKAEQFFARQSNKSAENSVINADANSAPLKSTSQLSVAVAGLNIAENQSTITTTTTTMPTLPTKKPVKLGKKKTPRTCAPSEQQRCEICDITLADKDQHAKHMEGKKHLKKLRSLSNVVAASGMTDKEREEGKKIN